MPDYYFSCYGTDFVWDNEKNITNIKKHGISFETAVHIFEDELRIEFPDEKHSTYDELRFNTIGLVHDVLTVVYTERTDLKNDNSYIRIISARKATRTEADAYNNNISGW